MTSVEQAITAIIASKLLDRQREWEAANRCDDASLLKGNGVGRPINLPGGGSNL